MASDFFGKVSPAAATYTQCGPDIPSGQNAVLTMKVLNQTAGPISIRIHTGTSVGSPNTEDFLEHNLVLQAESSGQNWLELTGFKVPSTHKVVVYASAVGVSFHCYGSLKGA